MGRKWTLLLITGAFLLLLTGCSIRAVEDLYQVPKRSDLYNSLQSVIDTVMDNHEYSAPLHGVNLQTVQMADLDGDGVDEYLLFTKSTAVDPLRIFIFQSQKEGFVVLDVIDNSGADFDRVEYVQLDDNPGVEIVLGRQIGKLTGKRVGVYSLRDGSVHRIFAADYSHLLCCDLNADGKEELMVLRPGAGTENGIAALYEIQSDGSVKTAAAHLSRPAERIRRLLFGRLEDGKNAVYVAEDVNGTSFITDIVIHSDDHFVNISVNNPFGNTIDTLRNAPLFADDIDEDGVLELPLLLTAGQTDAVPGNATQPVICWYSLDIRGTITPKMYTYHSIPDGWHLELDGDLAKRMSVEHQGSSYEFRIWDPAFTEYTKLYTVYVLSGPKREEQARESNRFVLLRTDSVIYAASLSADSAQYGLTQESLIQSFHLTVEDWITGKT